MSVESLRQAVLRLPSDEYARRRIALASGRDDLTDEEVLFIQRQFLEVLDEIEEEEREEEVGRTSPAQIVSGKF